jgi:hypothetical protein
LQVSSTRCCRHGYCILLQHTLLLLLWRMDTHVHATFVASVLLLLLLLLLFGGALLAELTVHGASTAVHDVSTDCATATNAPHQHAELSWGESSATCLLLLLLLLLVVVVVLCLLQRPALIWADTRTHRFCGPRASCSPFCCHTTFHCSVCRGWYWGHPGSCHPML